MKEQIRLFLAAELPAQVRARLLALLVPFEHPSIRLLPEQNLHLTLYFIGNEPVERLPHTQELVELVTSEHKAFALNLNCLELGPKPHTPRLVWARFDSSTPFETLSKHFCDRLAVAPVRVQKSIPHVTLARLRKDKPKPPHLAPVYPDRELLLPVKAVSLWQSVLASPHPTYSVLQTYPLG